MRLVLLPLCLLPSLLQAASFDCSRAEHPVELAICGNAALSELEAHIAECTSFIDLMRRSSEKLG